MIDEMTSGAEALQGGGDAPEGKAAGKLTPDDRGLVLVKLVHRGKYTSVSMDVELWRVLNILTGSEQQARRWVIDQARLIESLSGTATGIEAAKGAGLSRLVQRRVFELIAVRLKR